MFYFLIKSNEHVYMYIYIYKCYADIGLYSLFNMMYIEYV